MRADGRGISQVDVGGIRKGTDEGVLSRTLNVGFFRDSNGIPANADRLCKPWRIQLGDRAITGFFRDHHLSDLIGFVYSRMDPKVAAADLHSRLRALGEKAFGNQPLTLVALYLDPPVLNRPSCPAPLLEFGGEFQQAVLIEG